MEKNIILLSKYLTKFLVILSVITVSYPTPSRALQDNDPETVCKLYGCENGIPVTGPNPPVTHMPEVPGGRPPSVASNARFCAFYEHINFQGERGWLVLGTAFKYVGSHWNDEISSIACSPGCRMIAYEHRDFKGASREFPGSTPFVGADWNDRISALRVRCQ